MKARSSAFRRLRMGVGVGMVTVAAFRVGTVAAQTAYGGGQSSAYRARGNGNASNGGGTTYALSTVVAKMSSAAGMQILADRAVANDSVTAPTATTTAANVDEQIKALVAQLPSGTVSGKFYLPASAKGGYTADAVEAFAMAEARLFGPVGGADTQTSGAVEVLGQTLSSGKASTVVSDLNLQPVYLIGNPNGGANGGQYAQNGNYNNSANANNSSTVSQQAQTLMGMSATARNQALTQMANQNQQNQQVIGQVMQSLSAAERQQLMQSIGGMGGGFGGGGRGGFGGGPGGGGPGGPGGPR